ncbi:MAG: hypothetical protein K1W24_01245 [Lachnospiraceae bacterium]
MNYGVLAKKARYYKQDVKEEAAMCKIMEDIRRKVALNRAKNSGSFNIKITA